MTYSVRSFAWIVVYLLFVLLPLFALLTGSLPSARGFWTEFSAALGYSGLAIMGLQFRSRRASAMSPNRGVKMSYIISIGRFRFARSRWWSCTR